MPKLKFFGIMKVTIFKHVGIISGTGVGGGSLVYANTLPIPKSTFFKTGSWKDLNDWETELKPHYKEALRMLGAVKNQKLFAGDQGLKKVSQEMGIEDKFETTNVAVYFGEENVTKKDPYFEGKGPDRTGCNFCGACMTGCRNNSKNTLDKNYLYLAQQLGAIILAENEVIDVKPLESKNGYKVHLKSSTKFFKKRKTITTKGVIFSGGVLGTIKLLLKLKEKSLPNISHKQGGKRFLNRAHKKALPANGQKGFLLAAFSSRSIQETVSTERCVSSARGDRQTIIPTRWWPAACC